MNNEKKALLLLWTYIVIFLTPKTKQTKDNGHIVYNDNYLKAETPYATYNSKDIYIVDDLQEITTDNTNIYIIDNRDEQDPNISIYNSYQFKRLDDIDNILNLLIEYEHQYPSNWHRTLKSMKNEWLIHNICYFFNIQKSRTEQVDFNNDDEKIYLNYLKIIKEIMDTNNGELTNIKTRTLTKDR